MRVGLFYYYIKYIEKHQHPNTWQQVALCVSKDLPLKKLGREDPRVSSERETKITCICQVQAWT